MKKIDDLSYVADVLQSELKRRFIKYTAPGTADHNPVMLAATALDARYRLLLNPVQSESAKKLLLEQVSVLVHLHDLACTKQRAWRSLRLLSTPLGLLCLFIT